MVILTNGELTRLLQGEPPLLKSADKKYPINFEIQVQPASIDLRLSRNFLRFKKEVLFLDCLTNQEENMEWIEVKETEPIIIKPDEFILGQTLEEISLPSDTYAFVVARQSLARLGIITNIAIYMNPGYTGIIPLQIKNASNKPIVLRPYFRVCTAIFERLETNPDIPYSKRGDAKYQNEEKISPSKLSQDVELSKKSKENLKIILENYKIEPINQEFEYFINMLGEINSLILSEAFYISKLNGREQPNDEDIDEGSKNIKMILKSVFEGI